MKVNRRQLKLSKGKWHSGRRSAKNTILSLRSLLPTLKHANKIKKK